MPVLLQTAVCLPALDGSDDTLFLSVNPGLSLLHCSYNFVHILIPPSTPRLQPGTALSKQHSFIKSVGDRRGAGPGLGRELWQHVQGLGQ